MISLLLFILAVVCYTVSQKATFTDSEGWKNKYKQPMVPAPDNWYYKLFALKYREKFPGSGSLLVFATDRYHLFQMLFKIALCAAIGFRIGLWSGIIAFVLFGVVFTLVYKLLAR